MVGYEYRLGHAIEFGLESDFFVKGLTDSIAESWLVGVTVLIQVLNNIKWISVLFIPFVLLVYLAMVLFKRIDSQVDSDRLTEDNQGDIILLLSQWEWAKYYRVIKAAASLVWVLLSAGIFVFAILVLPYDYGKKSASRLITDYNDADCASPDLKRCTFLLDQSNGNVIASGLLVVATDSRIAIYSDGSVTVFPLLDSYKVQLKKKE